MKDRFIYTSFFTYAYSHKIARYQVDETLKSTSTIRIIQMANEEVLSFIKSLIHYSDRDIQYCSESLTFNKANSSFIRAKEDLILISI